MTIHGKDPALLRRINAAATSRLLYERGSMTLTEVVDATGLSRRTAESVLGALVESGTVQQLAPGNGLGAVGRPPRVFRFRWDSGLCLGLQVGRGQVEAMLTDLSGAELATLCRPVDRGAARSDRIAAVIEVARAVLAKVRLPRKRLRAVGVGTPGVVRPDGTVAVCSTIPDWERFSLRAELERWTRCPVAVDNDVNLAARAEHWRGAARDRDSVVWVLTGSSTRAAIIIGGRLYRGADGAAGEIGWLPALGWPAAPDRSADAGSVAGLARAMAPGLASLVLTVNPSMLVIGGVGADIADELLAVVGDELRPTCPVVPDLRISSVGADGVVLGAVRVAMDEVQHQLFAIR